MRRRPRPATVEAPSLSAGERFAAWVLTGPIGRVAAFFGDLAIYWWRWFRRRRLDPAKR